MQLTYQTFYFEDYVKNYTLNHVKYLVLHCKFFLFITTPKLIVPILVQTTNALENLKWKGSLKCAIL